MPLQNISLILSPSLGITCLYLPNNRVIGCSNCMKYPINSLQWFLRLYVNTIVCFIIVFHGSTQKPKKEVDILKNSYVWECKIPAPPIHLYQTYRSSGSETVGSASFDNCVFSISSITIQSGLTVTDDSLCLIWFGRL